MGTKKGELEEGRRKEEKGREREEEAEGAEKYEAIRSLF